MFEQRLRLYNTLTRTKEVFSPIDPKNVRMYVCGPTVYDFAHIGNARPVIVFDVLFRLLRHLYGADHVTYVRNITDVDDKINARALRDFGDDISSGRMSLNEAIRNVTEKTANQFHADVKALGCLEPNHEPRATEHIEGMVVMIQSLIDKGHAYIATGSEGREVLFDTSSMPDYGRLSGEKLNENIEGARIAVEVHKKNPADFVLWKESSRTEPGWDGIFTAGGQTASIHGRPGWHIECSVMSKAHLGETFDIHGGGLDLIFPHHENEIAQSRCAHGTDVMANVWMHNGYLQVEGKKMSKSEGNFVTINELLRSNNFGGHAWEGPVLRLAMLMTSYRHPIDFTKSRLLEARNLYYRLSEVAHEISGRILDWELDKELYKILENDLDTPAYISKISAICSKSRLSKEQAFTLYCHTRLIGINFVNTKIDKIASRAALLLKDMEEIDPIRLKNMLQKGYSSPFYKSGRLRPEAKLLSTLKALEKFSSRSLAPVSIATIRSQIRNELAHQRDKKSSSTSHLMNFIEYIDEQLESSHQIERLIDRRLAFIAEKNWAEADRIRDELLAQGIQLKDSKDSETGERVTTWEVKR